MNSTSFTVANIICDDDAMNFVMWVKLFIKRQVKAMPIDYIIKNLRAPPSVLQQDNTSSIHLEVNGKRSSTKQTRYINISYFYETAKVRSGDVIVLYHPTKEMVADILTKLSTQFPERTELKFAAIFVHTSQKANLTSTNPTATLHEYKLKKHQITPF